jgi:AcrR family transcriptional regulator
MTGNKRDAIMKAGRALFLRHGLRKVRAEEICADAGVSKRTFYKYFSNKDELAVAVLKELFEEGSAQVEGVLELDCPIEEKVRRIIAVKSQLAAETSATFYREALTEESAAGRFALEAQRAWDERVRRFYLEAQAKGQIRADIQIDVLMALLVRLRDVVKDPDEASLAPDFRLLVETVMRVFFYGIIPRPEAGLENGFRDERRECHD